MWATAPVTNASTNPLRTKSRTLTPVKSPPDPPELVAAVIAPEKPRSANDSRCSHADTSSRGITNDAATTSTSRGAVLMTLTPPSRMSDTVIGRSGPGDGGSAGVAGSSSLAGLGGGGAASGRRLSGASHGSITATRVCAACEHQEMQGYGPSSYGDGIADTYDAWY